MSVVQVLKYNGRRINNLKHLAQMVLFDEEKFLRFVLSYGVGCFQLTTPDMLMI